MKPNLIIAGLILVAGLVLYVLRPAPADPIDFALADLVATIPAIEEPIPPKADVVVRVTLPACPPDAVYCPVAEDEYQPRLIR